MINKSILVGRVTKDLELKHTQSNIAFVNFTIAVNRSFSNQNGEKEADFIRCIAWRMTAENLVKFNGKGSLIGVEGRIQTSTKEINGKTEFFTEIVAENVQFLESKNNRQQEGASSQQQQQNQYQQQQGYQQQPSYQQQNQYQQQGGYQQQSNSGYNNNANAGYQSQQGGYTPHDRQQTQHSQSYQQTTSYGDDDLPF